MIRRARQIVAALLALAAVIVLVVGVPVALVHYVGWPLPTSWPTVEELRRTAQVGIEDGTIVKTLAVIVWIAWVQVAAAVIVEAVGLARRTASRPLPLVPGLQPIAARLVATIALIAATASTPRVGAMAVPLDAAVAAVPIAMPATTESTDGPFTGTETRQPTTETTVVTTNGRDSWWALAEQHLGNGLQWREVRQLNLGREVAPGMVVDAETDQLEEGWRLLVPTDETEATSGTPATELADADVGEWHVEAGDHFWHIAKQTLTEAWDRTPTDAEVSSYWRETVDANRDRLAPPGDPDLIYPGQEFITPAVPADPLAASTDAADTSVHLEAPSGSGVPEATPPDDVPTTQSEAEQRNSRDWEAAIRGSTADAVPEPGQQEAAQAQADQDDEDARNGLGVPVNLPIGLAAAGLVGAGVVATLRWRRRAALRSRPPGYRLPTPLPEAEAQEAQLQVAALPERTLDDLGWLLASIPDDVHPALVTTTDDGTVMLLFDDTQELPDPPPPWTLADDGTEGPVGWTAMIGSRGPERSVGLPLLVALGKAGPTTVYANVAAMGTLTITGPDAAVRRRLRTMALEAATSRVALPVQVVVAGDDLFTTLDQISHVTDLQPAIDAALAEVDQGIIREDRTSRLLVTHDPSVGPSIPANLIGTVGLIVADGDEPTRWAMQLQDDQSGWLQLPDGGQVDLVLPDLDPEVVNSELERLDGGATAPMAETANAEPIAHPSTNGKPPSELAGSPTDPAWCEVRLLGPVQVHRDCEKVEGISPRMMEILAYLATHREGGVSKERLDDAVWAGERAPEGSQRVIAAMTKLRQALGDGPDGEPLVPRRTRSDRIVLSEHVGCDLDRTYAHIALARDLPAEAATRELDAALGLVRGEPFEDLPLSWGSEITQRAVIELQQAALDAARAHRAAGDYDAAEHAIRQGLKLYDPNDHLYLELAEIASAQGRPEQVHAIHRQLRDRHRDEADEVASKATGPSADVELAFQNLESVGYD